MINVTNLEQALARFSEERDWDQFHTPKNLVMALTGEVGELNEIFQWLTEAEAREAGRSPAVVDKLAKNALKYPADMVRGSSRKADSTAG